MFQASAQNYYRLFTNLWGRRQDGGYNGYGVGCFVNPTTVVTADHVLRQIQDAGCQIVVFRWDGTYFAEQIWGDSQWDVGVARIRQLHREGKPGAHPMWYPNHLTRMQLGYGLSVGYLSRLRRYPNAAEPIMYTMFFSASLAAPHTKGQWPCSWVLGGGHVEGGFSGGPVFTMYGSLISVIVGQLLIASETIGLPPLDFPLIAQTDSIVDAANSAIDSK